MIGAPGFILLEVGILRAGIRSRWATWHVMLSSWFGSAAPHSLPLFAPGGIGFGIEGAVLGFGAWTAAEAIQDVHGAPAPRH